MFPVIDPVLSLSPSWFTEAIRPFSKSLLYLSEKYTEIPKASSPTHPSPSSEMASSSLTLDFANSSAFTNISEHSLWLS